MKAAVIDRPGHVVVQDVARPEPGAAQVRVRITGCGVCGSNVPVWEGRPWFHYPVTPPGAPGHEGWGVVDAVGSDIADLQPGDPVVLLSGNAFAEYDVAAASSVVPIPPALAGLLLPGEPLACAMNVFERADIRAGQSVVVIGVGFLGAVITSLAVRADARVTAVSRRAFSRRLAWDLGAAETRAFEECGGLQAERVVECVGNQAALDLASDITAVRGRLVIAGYHQDGARAVNMQLWNWRGIDVINAHERDPAVYVRGLRAAITAVVDRTIDLAPLLTHTFELAQLPHAFRLMAERPDGFLKAVVRL